MAENLVGRLRSGLAWSMIESWSVQALQLIVFMVVARHVDAVALGLAAIALLIGQLFQTTLLSGISTPLVRADDDGDPVLEDTAFWLSVGASALLLALTALVARTAEEWFRQPGLAHVLILLGIGNVLTGLNVVPQAWLTRRLQMRPLAVRSSVSALGGGVVGVALAIYGFGVNAIIAQNIVTAALSTLILWRATPWRPHFRFSRVHARSIAHYGRHISLTGLTNFFNSNSDTMVIGTVLGPAATGVYAVGKRALTASGLLLSQALSRVSLPIFSQLRKDPPRLARAYLRLVRATAAITMPAFVGLALIAPEFVPVFFGAKWGAAIGVMQALTLFGALQALGLFNQALMLSMGKPHWQTALTLIYAVVNIVTFYAAVHLGMVAVAIAFTARAYFLYPLSILAVVKLIPVSWGDYARAVALPVIGCAVMTIVEETARPAFATFQPLPRMMIAILIGASTYGVVVALFGRSDLRDIASFARGRSMGHA